MDTLLFQFETVSSCVRAAEEILCRPFLTVKKLLSLSENMGLIIFGNKNGHNAEEGSFWHKRISVFSASVRSKDIKKILFLTVTFWQDYN